MIIKLTSLFYKIKTDSLEKYHNINQHSENLLFDWEKEVEKAKDMGTEYPIKPFIEPFEFEDSDYTVKEKPLRIRLKDIYSYRLGPDNIVELTTGSGEMYTIKDTIEFLDKLFE